MTPPPPRLVRLHLDSRQTGQALTLLVAVGFILRASQYWTRESGLFPQLTLLLITVAAAAVIATGTRNPFGEPEHTASSPLAALRLAHLLTLTATAVGAFTLAGLSASYGIGAAALLRNLAGLTGIALLTAVLLGAHLAWTAPLGYVMFCGAELDAQVTNVWTWPTLPATDHTATIVSLTLLTAGLAAVTVTGARDRHSDPP
jgi:hypothetical protein